jgi:hypothetical protein
MRDSRSLFALAAVLLALVPALLIGGATPASGGIPTQGPICGVIDTTRTLTHDAWLTCDVQCRQSDHRACIEFGRPNIKLSLNGFKMTGPANVPSRQTCSAANEFGPPFEADGIHSKFDEVQIVGPGVVQRMRRHGIGLIGTQADPLTKAQVKKVTSHMNCFSGVFLFWNSETLLDEVVSVKNSANGEARSCGGICVTNSSRNTVRRSEVAGNGTTDPGAPTAPEGNDFGIGLVGESDFNLIEENGVGGNINGLAIFPAFGFLPQNNLIKRNVFAGNPPTEVYDKRGPGAGSDVRDFVGAAAGNNRFEENLCLTYTVGTGLDPITPSPCIGIEDDPVRPFVPKVPQFAGHQNN